MEAERRKEEGERRKKEAERTTENGKRRTKKEERKKEKKRKKKVGISIVTVYRKGSEHTRPGKMGSPSNSS